MKMFIWSILCVIVMSGCDGLFQVCDPDIEECDTAATGRFCYGTDCYSVSAYLDTDSNVYLISATDVASDTAVADTGTDTGTGVLIVDTVFDSSDSDSGTLSIDTGTEPGTEPDTEPDTVSEVDTSVDTDTGTGVMEDSDVDSTSDSSVEEYFSIIVIPDTQGMVKYRPSTDTVVGAFSRLAQWIVSNQDALRLRFVIQVGDVVSDPNDLAQWQDADDALEILDGAGIGYSIATGNHDRTAGDADHPWGDYTNYNSFFPVSRFQAMNTFGGSFRSEEAISTYHTFTTPFGEYLVVSFEFGASNESIEWANAVIDAHPSHSLILSTHAYLNAVGQRMLDSEYKSPCNGYDMPTDNCHAGEYLYQQVLLGRDQARFAFCGHISAEDGDGSEHLLTDSLSQQMVTYPWSGSFKGAIRIVKVYSDRVEVSSFGTYGFTDLIEPDNNFVLTL